MNRKFKWITGGVLIASALVIAGINDTIQKNQSEAKVETAIGSAKAVTDQNYTLKEMLTYAIQDEYMAQAEYDAIMKKYGTQKPFSNIIRSEAKHIDLLLPLLQNYDVTVPKNDAANRVAVPASLEKSYTAGVQAEEKNIAMYEGFLKEKLPSDVEAVFQRLLANSQYHLAAFQRAEEGKVGDGMENGTGNRSGNGINGHDGMGMNSGKHGAGNGMRNGGDCQGK